MFCRMEKISTRLKNSARSYLLHKNNLYVNLSGNHESCLEVLKMLDAGFVKKYGVGSSRIKELTRLVGILPIRNI